MKYEKKSYKYIFSVVIAVYNCAPFLRDTLDSITEQCISAICRYVNGVSTDEPIPFEHLVQVIMVDDGSTDGSDAICDEYAAKYPNFEVIHKENGGVASARNAGLARIEGKYMNFLDSDDKFSPSVFATVYDFFEKHYNETDVVTIPLEFFDAVSGPHWQNYKFGKRSRVVDLFNEYDSPLMFVNASFFKSEYKDKISFNGKLVCGEDIRYISEILSNKMTLGLVVGCRYYYRRRSYGEESIIQSSKKKLGWYFDYFTYLVDWCVDFCKNKWGYIPAYYQNILVCDLKWRFSNEYDETAMKLLGKDGFSRYKEVLFASLRHFDDKYILNQRSIFIEHKYMMLVKKHASLPERCVYPDDVRLRFGNTLFCWLSSCMTKYDFIKIEEGSLIIEGYSYILGYPENASILLFYEVDTYSGQRRSYECEITERDMSISRLGEVMFRAVSFKARIPLPELDNGGKMKLVMYANGDKIVKKDIRFGPYCPIGKEYSRAYYFADSYAVSTSGYTLTVKKCTRAEAASLERKFIKQLSHSDAPAAQKAAKARVIARLYKRLFKKPVWIINDRVNKASDNGEAFFRYLCESGFKGANFVFAIEKSSADYERLKQIGRVVDRSSRAYKFLRLVADAVISSHADDGDYNPFGTHLAPYRDMLNSARFIFLQHGITVNDMSSWLNRYSRNISGFVCAAKPEADSIKDGTYYYNRDQVWLTGFPRFDRLYDKSRRFVTVMPTWRMYLSAWDNHHAGVWRLAPGFLESEYYKFYNSLINDNRLISACKSAGYTLCFMPHPNVIEHVDLFDKHADVVFFGIDKEYRDIYAESALVLTDYSSAALDFAYLKKPVIYAQFDREEFFSGAHVGTPGYFDFERDGLGEVTYDYDSTVDKLIEYIKSGCKMKEKYLDRRNRFFAFSDKNNSRRLLEKILETE